MGTKFLGCRGKIPWSRCVASERGMKIDRGQEVPDVVLG
jgi:hypothetical protein